MVTVQICVGSSCFLRGAPEVIDRLRELVAAHELSSQVTLKGCFCLEECTKGGVTIKIGDELLTGVTAKDLDELFGTRILPAARR